MVKLPMGKERFRISHASISVSNLSACLGVRTLNLNMRGIFLEYRTSVFFVFLFFALLPDFSDTDKYNIWLSTALSSLFMKESLIQQ